MAEIHCLCRACTIAYSEKKGPFADEEKHASVKSLVPAWKHNMYDKCCSCGKTAQVEATYISTVPCCCDEE